MRSRGHAALLAAWLCIVLAWVGAGCGSQEETKPSAAPHASVSPIGSLRSTLQVFQGEQTSADVIPKNLVSRSIAKQVGLDLRTSRRARTYKGRPIFVVLSDELACTYSTYHPVGNCWPIDTVKQGLAFATSLCGLGTAKGETVLYGIVPDSVERVMVPRENVPDRTVPVVGNVFVASTSSAPPLPRHLALFENGNRIVRPSGIPADVAREGCSTTPPKQLPSGHP